MPRRRILPRRLCPGTRLTTPRTRGNRNKSGKLPPASSGSLLRKAGVATPHHRQRSNSGFLTLSSPLEMFRVLLDLCCGTFRAPKAIDNVTFNLKVFPRVKNLFFTLVVHALAVILYAQSGKFSHELLKKGTRFTNGV